MWKILNVGRFAGVEEKAIARLGDAKVRAAYVEAGIKNPNGKTFNISEANRRLTVLEKLDSAISPDVKAASARVNGETLQGAMLVNAQLEREHSSKPAPQKTTAEIAKEIIATGVMPSGFETWSKPKQIELVQAMIPLADARTRADLISIEAELSGKQSPSTPQPKAANALDAATIRELHTHVFGEQATKLAAYDCSPDELTFKLTKAFHLSGLTVPGLDTAKAVSMCGQPKEATGLARGLRILSQQKVDGFFKAKQPSTPTPAATPISDADLKKLAYSVLGASSVSESDTRADITRKFFQAHLEVPGLDYSGMAGVYRMDLDRIKGLSKVVRAEQQSTINRIVSKSK